MSFVVECPNCAKRLKVKDEARGTRVRCPECREPIELDENDDLDEPVVRKPRPSSKTGSKKSRKSKSKGGGFSWVLIGGIGTAVLLLAVISVGGYAMISSLSKSSASSAAWVKHTEPDLFEIETPAPFGPDPEQVGKANVRSYLAKHDGILYSLSVISGLSMSPDFQGSWQTIKTKRSNAGVQAKFTEVRYLGEGQFAQGGFEGCEEKIETKVTEYFQHWLRKDGLFISFCMTYSNSRSDPKSMRDRFFGSLKFINGQAATTPASTARPIVANPAPLNGPAWVKYQHADIFEVDTPVVMQTIQQQPNIHTNLRAIHENLVYNCAVGNMSVDPYAEPEKVRAALENFLRELQTKTSQNFREKTFLQQGRIEGVQVKSEIPNKGVVHIQYWFIPGKQFATFELGHTIDRADPKTKRERFFGSIKFLNP